ncbi:MAG TPA: penicillin acylase family protein, partial [Ferruginibacter sp.]|nr:penicillin acylase family protein [Ferruginibacter sp.]
KYFNLLRQWNLRNDTDSKGATIFQLTWKHFRSLVFDDEFAKAPKPSLIPFESTLLEAVLKDSSYKFIDDINSSSVESIADIITAAFKDATKELSEAETNGRLEWGKYKDTRVNHLTKLPAFSRLHLPIGGGTNIINATKEAHGPSWRMIVHLTSQTEAYGVYPGGQSGNPGSRFYDNFIDTWVSGKYYTLWMMTKNEVNDPRIKWKLNFDKQAAPN